MKILNQIEMLDEKINMLVNQNTQIRDNQQQLEKKLRDCAAGFPP